MTIANDNTQNKHPSCLKTCLCQSFTLAAEHPINQTEHNMFFWNTSASETTKSRTTSFFFTDFTKGVIIKAIMLCSVFFNIRKIYINFKLLRIQDIPKADAYDIRFSKRQIFLQLAFRPFLNKNFKLILKKKFGLKKPK